MSKDLEQIYLFSSVVGKMKTYSLAALIAFGILAVLPFYVDYPLLYNIGGILSIASAFAFIVGRWRPKERILIDGKAVFISGCDRGFGYMLTQRLDDIGFHVFAGCLFPEGNGAESLRKSGSKRLHVIGLDVTSDSSIQQAVTYVEENLGDNVLWAVVNNAGIVEVGELCWVSMESVIKTVDVNTLGVIRLTKAVLPKLKESRGRVVAVASITARISVPYLVPYSMSKAAVIALCDGLRRELYKWNIQVISIEPILYSTPMANIEEVTTNSRRLWTSAPENVKDFYGSDSIVDKLNNVFGYFKYFIREPTEVVSVIEDAITVLYPKYTYTPGSAILAFCVWISKALPKTVVDMIMYVATEFIV